MAPFFTSGECDAGWRFAYTGLRAVAAPGGASLTLAWELWLCRVALRLHRPTSYGMGLL